MPRVQPGPRFRRALSSLVALLPMAGLSGPSTGLAASLPAEQVEPAGPGRPAAPRRMFVSGHSLTAPPLPNFIAALSAAAGQPLTWDMQHLYGSSLRARTAGEYGSASGYRAGIDRRGAPADVLRAFASPSAPPPYDTLIVTEQHALLDNLMSGGTITHLLDYHARFIRHNPAGETYLFASWLNLGNRDDPRRWLAYERAAALGWACTAAQANAVLARREQRPIRVIPAAEGLARLVAQAVGSEGVAGVTASSTRKTLARLFVDEVHLTPLGTYYVALLSHIALHGGLPRRRWAPDLDAVAVEALERVASGFMAEHQRRSLPAAEDCPGELRRRYVGPYLSYVRDTEWLEAGWARAWLRWAKRSIAWRLRLLGDVGLRAPIATAFPPAAPLLA